MALTSELVVITGASSGIGRATALAAAVRGARVVLVARTVSKLEAVREEIEAAGGEAHVVPMDLSDPAAVRDGCATILDLGVPDVVVNNAGAGRWRAVEETDLDEVAFMMSAPYFAAFYTTRCLLPAMLERGTGTIVNVNSPAGLLVIPGATGYTAARQALHAFDEGLGLELRGSGVKVMHLVAAEVTSSYFEHNPDSHERIPGIAALFPVSTPEQVADRLLDGVARGRRRVHMPWTLDLVIRLHRLAPWTVEPLVWWTSWRRPTP